ncbi:hypothetical protein CDL12_29558 [Handroanthus impetiginosus]|uniref:Uncharacterized protein n=1 Tax=Handroanthus impetiginosus TaxID=429701 RepID=A0A2G9FY23_9LAMI|nr:hypothetical protein CDL12_29558 [Handroanthus impetiginosus]
MHYSKQEENPSLCRKENRVKEHEQRNSRISKAFLCFPSRAFKAQTTDKPQFLGQSRKNQGIVLPTEKPLRVRSSNVCRKFCRNKNVKCHNRAILGKNI